MVEISNLVLWIYFWVRSKNFFGRPLLKLRTKVGWYRGKHSYNSLFLLKGGKYVRKKWRISKKLFSGKLDKGGYPYLDHLYEVSNNVTSEDAKIVGLLHDVLEDTETTREDLLEMGYSEFIVSTIEILTRGAKEDYDDYIERIIKSNNKIALEVKLADLKHNMDISRIKNPTPKDLERVEKRYRKAFIKISNKLEELKW